LGQTAGDPGEEGGGTGIEGAGKKYHGDVYGGRLERGDEMQWETGKLQRAAVFSVDTAMMLAIRVMASGMTMWSQRSCFYKGC
jgi:hypothetical protein